MVFVRRFFTQQFKRSAMPDGLKVGLVTLRPAATGACPPTPRQRYGCVLEPDML